MAKVQWSAGIDHVSGALAKPGKGQHSCKNMLLGTHRVAPTTNPDCSRVYLRDLNSVTRSTPVTAKETTIRTKFAAVSEAVNTRLHDQSKQADDLAAFNAQKDDKNGKKTLRSYIWSLEAAAYDQNNG